MRKILAVMAALAAGPAVAQQAADAVQPEATTSGGFAAMSPQVAAALQAKEDGVPVQGKTWMVAAANPHAVQAGADVLAAGGTAADALVAVQTVLGLVEPQSSGLGGGAFLVWYDAASGQLTTLDGRETAPLAATPKRFLDAEGEPLKFYDAVVGGLSVGVPGTPALLATAQAKWGKGNWADLLQPAITLAQDGFDVSPRLAALVAEDAERLARFESTASYFLPQGQPLQAGARLTNVAYADTLRTLADDPRAFYTGAIAQDIADTVNAAVPAGGLLSKLDFTLYAARERDAVCAPFQGHEVCGMGPPSSGALTVGQILGMLDNYDLGALDPADPQAWRLIGDASRLAFADRGRYMADSDFVPMPTAGLVDPAYLAERAKLLGGDDALPEVSPGTPEWDHAMLLSDDESIELPSTSHISIVDSYGNVASMTTTIENGFGSRLMVRGFLLNNELTDFSFRTHSDGVPIANRLEPGKRPRSSMAPTIVMKDGAPVLAIGSPGGSRIIGYVAQAIIAHLAWGMDVQQAVAMPHAVNRFGTYDLEAGTTAADLEGPLGDMGFDVKTQDLNSGLHAIEIGDDLKGGADPRREGIALGD
ncbi:gamma-glutamyltransferase [Pseudosulfitobacter pseudonitzschiae]|uniref:gamma-glutamyltransferase n=1 Tax=Pseudosulfitobacter pseudonitzschiae TaxID=1402135 RepID=UPI001AF8E91A|nr:gamma-glutamyltransferase [Pseudosulfitobacter pseudonitzschiae]MBM1816284.1 gamma-glutamyltransferase [Pseudosulfitobacter pseudonitzschiae]MBM1833797.1 gamma-glutamyltransferase [Pseudosulfitobacter pseudonitzschiae]MBM1838663.1 gamma-glutamyltransferase [Pseudosulfitobacter pseudonitzschiae]MBM1843011.1 gamma-glutamyltransferase [Pseudosulfitobacter pseudonitzschiae]MBM1847877.1 gamma-glutamyltransferase [Pseudosulfitobacter pseudonitzschiae]